MKNYPLPCKNTIIIPNQKEETGTFFLSMDPPEGLQDFSTRKCIPVPAPCWSEGRVLVVDGTDVAPARCLHLIVRVAGPGRGGRGGPGRAQALRQLGRRRHQVEDLLRWGTPGGLVGAVRAGGAGGDEAEVGVPAREGQREGDCGGGAGS